MPIIDKTVPAPELIGTPGYPMHYEAYGLPAPTKIIQVLVDDDGNEIVEGPPDGGPPPPPAIADISRQQCAMRMCQMGLIGPEEMVAMAQNGTPPAMVENMLGAMPEPDQSFARAAFAKNTYSRTDPLLVLLMTGQPVPVEDGDPRPATDEDIDQFFTDAALL